MKFLWWKRTHTDPSVVEESKRRYADADALARRLAAHRERNHFGERLHAALIPRKGH